ncbi:MAG TPA: DUF4912 domain-containing protein [Candidatus Binatia bacterium]|jgi:hypothetical protein|nr:DUF4912 domain-containing protein [Candidatus Binatia bacterium]
MNEKQSGPDETASAPGEPAAGEPAPPPAPAPPSLKIPSILLEGDDEPGEPPPPAPARPSAPSAAAAAPEPELPEAYGTGRVLLTARDPYCLYAHWDLTGEQQRRFAGLSAAHELSLRVHPEAQAGQAPAEVRAGPNAQHCFIQVQRAGVAYCAELGYYQADRQWRVIATSEPVRTPPDAPARDKMVRFATFFADTPLPGLKGAPTGAEQLRAPPGPSTPSVENRELPAGDAGVSSVAGPMPEAETGPGEPWTVAQDNALAEYLGPALARHEWLGSDQIERLLRPQFEQGGSLASAQFSLPGVAVSSPLGGEGRKGFWLNVNAELVIYGATEPDAQVSIAGRPIQLQPDGTFSYRLAFPDGTYALPMAAISVQGELRQAELTFHRDSKYQGEVGAGG